MDVTIDLSGITDPRERQFFVSLFAGDSLPTMTEEPSPAAAQVIGKIVAEAATRLSLSATTTTPMKKKKPPSPEKKVSLQVGRALGKVLAGKLSLAASQALPQPLGNKLWKLSRAIALTSKGVMLETFKDTARCHVAEYTKSLSKKPEANEAVEFIMKNTAVRNYYLDEKGEPVPETDLLAWAKKFEAQERRVARDEVGHYTVSTVFLGLDHAYPGRLNVKVGHVPILWETMVFGKGNLSNHQERCSGGRAEAVAMHARVCQLVKNDLSAATPSKP